MPYLSMSLHLKFLIVGVGSAMLAGCITTDPLKSTGSGIYQTLLNAANLSPAKTETASGQPLRPDPEGPRPSFDAEKASFDLTKTDGTACSAVSDGGILGNLAAVSRIGVNFAAIYAANNLSNGTYQAQLDEIKPAFKELSRNVLWLPVEAETLLGDAFFRISKYQPAPPPRGTTNRKIVNDIRQVFDQMVSYAREELKSPLTFRATFVTRDKDASMQMLPGGHLIVPENVIILLSQEKDEAVRSEIIHYMVAHEMSHALRRHYTKMAQVNLVDGILIADRLKSMLVQRSSTMDAFRGPESLGRMIDFSASTIDTLVGEVCATQRWMNQLEQSQEHEADVCGAKLLHEVSQGRAGRSIDPLRAAKNYERLKDKASTSGAKSKVATKKSAPLETCFESATHPSVDARQGNLHRYWVTLNPKYRSDLKSEESSGRGNPNVPPKATHASGQRPNAE